MYKSYEWFGIEFQGIGFPDEAAEGFSSAVLNGAGGTTTLVFEAVPRQTSNPTLPAGSADADESI